MNAIQDSRQAGDSGSPPRWLPYVVASLLLVYYVLAVTATFNKSNTYDEGIHLTAGYSYWHLNNYRLHPENGNLPQRWAAIPLLVSQPTFPSLDQWKWAQSSAYGMASDFLFHLGNPLESMLLQGRAMIALFGVAVCLLVYLCSRKLFGWKGGLLSLVLAVFCPSLLAHGGQITSDMCATLFFLLTVAMTWRLLHAMNWRTWAAATLCIAGLFLAKYSAVLIVPVVAVAVLVRIFDGRALLLQGWRGERRLDRRQMILPILAVFLLQMVFVWGAIWAAYGFTFSPFADPTSEKEFYGRGGWELVLDGKLPSRRFHDLLVWSRSVRLLPDPYLFGLGNSIRLAQERQAFLNGDYRSDGWLVFFPLAFLMKTPLPTLLIFVLAGIAALTGTNSGADRRLWDRVYAVAPLYIFLAVFCLASVTSKLNIGHRHILPIYPPVFVLAGVAARWWQPVHRSCLSIALVLNLLLCWLVVETIARWPHYLAFFNQGVGGPRNGHLHLVDSSLDWGQDLPGLKKWLEQNGLLQARVPFYISYFGTAEPEYYGIKGISLPVVVQRPADAGIAMYVPGVYCISATHLQGVYQKVYGPWTADHEKDYRDGEQYLRTFQRFYALLENDEARKELLAAPNLLEKVNYFHALCFARLCNYLRAREPIAHIGYSILIYHVSQDDLERSLQPFGD